MNFKIGRSKPKTDLKMPAGIPYIIGNEAAERFSYYGMRCILIIFMTQYLLDDLGKPQFTELQAMVWYHIFVAACYLFSILGAITADVFLGKYKTIKIFSSIYFLGHCVLALFVSKIGLFCGLTLIALGAGGIKPCVAAHAGDQFNTQNKHLIAKGYSWFYLAISAGATPAVLLIPYLLKKYGPSTAFLIPGILMLIAIIIFCSGKNLYIKVPPIGWKKYLNELSDINNIKTAKSIFLTFIFISFFFCLMDQGGSSWVIQATKMNREINLGFIKFTLEPSQIQFLDGIFTIIFTPLCAYIVYPFFEKFTEVTHFKRVVVGFFLGALSLIIVTIAQILIEQGVKINVIWQIWSFVFFTAASVLVMTTSIEICYLYAPKSMKSIFFIFYVLAAGVGNLFTALISFIIQNLNNGVTTVNAGYFGFFAVLMIIVGTLFTLYAPSRQETIFLQKIRNSLPNPTLGYQSKIKQITDIILSAGQKNIILIILFYPFNRNSLAKHEDDSGIRYEYASDYKFLIVIKDKVKKGKKFDDTYIINLESDIEEHLMASKIESRTSFDSHHGVSLTIKGLNDFNYEIDSLKNGKKGSDKSFLEGFFENGTMLYSHQNYEIFHIWHQASEKNYQELYIYGTKMLKLAKNHPKDSIFHLNFVTFCLHQVAESFYRSSFLFFTQKRSTSHELKDLKQKLCAESNLFANVFSTNNPREQEAIELLEKSYTGTRYGSNFLIEKDQVEYLIRELENLEKLTGKACHL